MADEILVRFRFKLVLEKDGLWYADSEDVQGCHGVGATREEAADDAILALQDHLTFRLENAVRPRFAVHAKSNHSRVDSFDVAVPA